MIRKIIKNITPYGILEWYKNKKGGINNFKKRFCEVAHALEDGGRFECRWKDRFPCLTDATSSTSFEPHYLYHPAWACRILAKTKPNIHVDISSSLNFVAMASAFIPIRFYDLRPADLSLTNLQSESANILALPFEDEAVASISCMHVVEHIGLERYGDVFDPKGDIHAMRELSRVVAPGGQLLFVVPVGRKSLVEYNAHRIYHFEDVICHFTEFYLEDFSLVTDSGQFIEGASPELAAMQKWGCGCFHFIKK